VLGDCSRKLGRENILKPTIGNENLHQDSNDNGDRIVHFDRSKNLVVKRTIFPHRNIHKYTWASPEGMTHNQIDHIMIDSRWHSIILDVRSFRGANCDTGHYLVVAKVFSVSKQSAQKVDAESFNLGELNELEVGKQYQVDISNRFAEKISRDWENSKGNIKTSAKESLGLHELHGPCTSEIDTASSV
jgi:hypothetical protein